MHLELISRKTHIRPKKRPMLFVHGACYAAWEWDEHFLPYFAHHGRDAYAVSLRGHGGSGGKDGVRWTGLDEYVEDVREAVRRIGHTPILAGHSMGGIVVQQYLRKYHAPAAVLIAAPLKYKQFPSRATLERFLYSFERHPLALLKRYATLDFYRFIRNPAVARTLLFAKDMPEEKIKHYARQFEEESLVASFEAAFLPRLKPGELKTPLFLIGAAEDKLIPPDYIEESARIYGADFRLCSGVAHNMMLDLKWRTVADAIAAWLGEKGF